MCVCVCVYAITMRSGNRYIDVYIICTYRHTTQQGRLTLNSHAVCIFMCVATFTLVSHARSTPYIRASTQLQLAIVAGDRDRCDPACVQLPMPQAR